MNLDFLFTTALFESLLGSSGTRHPVPRRSFFTDLEKTVLNIPFRAMLLAYQVTWEGLTPLRVETTGLELSPHSVHICRPSEVVLVTSYHLTLGTCEGKLEISIPMKEIKSRLPAHSYDRHRLNGGQPVGVDLGTVPIDALYGARVPVSVRLGCANLLYQDLAGVEVGDIVRLDTEMGAPIEVIINDQVKYLALPGVHKGSMSARILNLVDPP